MTGLCNFNLELFFIFVICSFVYSYMRIIKLFPLFILILNAFSYSFSKNPMNHNFKLDKNQQKGMPKYILYAESESSEERDILRSLPVVNSHASDERIFKSPLDSNSFSRSPKKEKSKAFGKAENSSNKQELAKTLKTRIQEAFALCPIIPLDSFSHAYCNAHGIMFDYKTAPCHIPKHPHPSLSKFLRCYSSILEFKEYKKLYVILKTKEMEAISKKRLSSYVVKASSTLFKCSVEALCANLFAFKSTVSFEDFLNLFLFIYKISFPDVMALFYQDQDSIRRVTPMEFLSSLKSPNMIIVKKNDCYNFTITPLHSSEYKDWESTAVHRKIKEIESSLLVSEESIKPSVLLVLNPLSRCFIKSTNKNLLKIADLNVPKLLQKSYLYSLEDLEFGDLWMYYKESINFDGKRPFF